MVFQIASLDDRFFVHRIGALDDEQMAAIAEMLGELLELGGTANCCSPSRRLEER